MNRIKEQLAKVDSDLEKEFSKEEPVE